MTILNLKTVTIAIKDLLKQEMLPKHKGLTIVRNRPRNENPNLAFSGWIGIYKANTDMEAHAMGPKIWRSDIEVLIEIQFAHAREEDAEDGLHDLEQEVLNILGTTANTQLKDTVSFTQGYSINYEILTSNASSYWQSSLITLRAEART